MTVAKAIMQFQLDVTGGLIIHWQNHGASTPLLDESVLNLYCITFIKREGAAVIPLGGIFISTDLHHSSNAAFTKMVNEIAGLLSPSKNLIGTATTIKPTLLSSGASTSDLETFAATEFTKRSVQGTA